MTTHFEAKLHGFRRTQDGVVVSYVVHPTDVSAELATAALGTRYMVAVAEIGDDERPKDDKTSMARTADAPSPLRLNGEVADNPHFKPEAKSPRKWSELTCAAQAGIRCGEPTFQAFLDCLDADEAAEIVRQKCRVNSRSQITTANATGELWLALEEEYQSYLTDQQYGGAVR